jgi:signal transduction histidine kinase
MSPMLDKHKSVSRAGEAASRRHVARKAAGPAPLMQPLRSDGKPDMADPNPLHILVIEDNPDTRANLCDVLELDGHRVESAVSLAAALERIDWRDVSVIILDEHPPDGAAVGLLPQVQRLVPHVPIVVVAAQANQAEAIAALRAGAYDYILKPIDPDALRARLQRIIERRLAERRLAESEARHRALLNAIPDAMLRIRRDGVCLDFRASRDSDRAVWGGDVIGAHIRGSSLPANTIDHLLQAIDRALASGSVQRLEYSLPTADGMRYFEARVVKSGVDEVVAIVRDVTGPKRAEERSLQAERLAAIGQMVAGLAHESRNAFQRSQACLEMLALLVEDRPEALELVDRIQKAQDHLHYLYEEVRHYAAPINLRRQPCNLAHVWRDTWAHLEVERRQKDVRLFEEVGAVDLTCQADPNALEQVFRNVLENAISACVEPGRIEIRCVETVWDGRDAVRISVRDNGPGFDPPTGSSVFEPFFTTKTKGTGLGLAIVRRLVEAHGGHIAVGDALEPGAEIVIVLPRAP